MHHLISQQHTSTEGGGGCVREIRRNDERQGGDEREEGPFMDVVERLTVWGGDLVEAKFLPPPCCRSIFGRDDDELGRTLLVILDIIHRFLDT